MDFQFSVLIFLILPVLISASLHMVIVRTRFLSVIAIPISTRFFGTNKTWRGLIAMPLLTSVSFIVVSVLLAKNDLLPSYWPNSLSERAFLGFLLGLAYIFFELPNSFAKRHLGIPPGKKSSQHAWFFVLVDQADSALGCAICYYFLIPESAVYFIPIIVFGPIVHLIGNILLYNMGLRKEAF